MLIYECSRCEMGYRKYHQKRIPNRMAYHYFCIIAYRLRQINSPEKHPEKFVTTDKMCFWDLVNFPYLVGTGCGRESEKWRKNKNPDTRMGIWIFGTPKGTRTPDLLIRSQSLYPTELSAHVHLRCQSIVTHLSQKSKYFFEKILKIFRNVFCASGAGSG